MRRLDLISFDHEFPRWNICYFGVTETIGIALAAEGTAAAAGGAAASAAGLAEVGIAGSLASAGIAGIGAIQSGKASAAASKYNASVAAENATVAQQNATWAANAGEEQAAEQGQKTKATVGAIKAAQAANNIDVNSGSAVDVRSSAAELGQLSAINIRSNAARTAYGYETKSASDTAQSKLDQFDAGQQSLAGEVGAGSTILGATGSAATNYAKFLQTSSPLTA